MSSQDPSSSANLKAVPVKKRRKSNKATRQQLLNAARQELIEGDGDLELAKVAKRAGVSDGLTYYHFGNKAGLIKALVLEFYDAMDERITAVPFDGETWTERERARVFAMVSFFYENPVALLVSTRLRTEPALLQEAQERSLRLSKLGARNIQQAQRAGEISSNYNPLLLVSMILAGVTEGVRTALSAESAIPLTQAQEEIWSFVARAAGVNP